jgi:hypothetical protein
MHAASNLMVAIGTGAVAVVLLLRLVNMPQGAARICRKNRCAGGAVSSSPLYSSSPAYCDVEAKH